MILIRLQRQVSYTRQFMMFFQLILLFNMKYSQQFLLEASQGPYFLANFDPWRQTLDHG